jgi:hypothetical protein
MTAAAHVDEIPVNPRLPPKFDDTPNDARPQSHQRWWFRPYIVTEKWCEPTGDAAYWTEEKRNEARAEWFRAWPAGTRYDVRCLDGGAWDRSTWWGSFSTLAEAQQCARGRDPQRFAKAGLVR